MHASRRVFRSLRAPSCKYLGAIEDSSVTDILASRRCNDVSLIIVL